MFSCIISMVVSNTKILSRQEFAAALKDNKGVLILKLGADWCGPCKQVQQLVYEQMALCDESITNVIVDVDESFDLYAYLKTKKVVTGIPALLGYRAGNTHFAPDEFVMGADPTGILEFFKNCKDGL